MLNQKTLIIKLKNQLEIKIIVKYIRSYLIATNLFIIRLSLYFYKYLYFTLS